MKIVAVGDIMPGGILAGINEDYVSKEIKDILDSADICVGTLETAIGNEPSFYGEKMRRKADVIYAKDADLIKLKDLHIDIVSLANNHFFDLGPEGAVHTIELLDSMGIKHIGAGSNLDEASKPVIVEYSGKKVAFLAFCDWRDETVGWCPIAAKKTPGVNPMYDDYVIQQIQKYKKQNDIVIVIPHWGREYQTVPTQEVYKLSKKMAKAGADLILGGHTHCIQPIIRKHKCTIVYSLGNFLFPDRLITTPRSTYYPSGAVDLSTLPATESYPDHVETITFKKWRPIARFGQLVKVDPFSSKWETFYCYLDAQNHLSQASRDIPNIKKIKTIKLLMDAGILGCVQTVVKSVKSFFTHLKR